MNQFKIVDLFCGMGNFRAGFEKAGAECVYSVEWDQHKREIYKVIYGHEPDANDIRTVEARDIPYADCWCFGSPCQDFSVAIAGRRKGMDGDRSSLVREVFRLLREKEPEDRPEWLIYENVKGMLSSNKGWDYGFILAEMDDIGYDCEWNLLNSKNFGVPQNRERVYTCGHLRARGSSGQKIFPLGESNQPIGQYVTDYKQLPQVMQIAMCKAERNNPNQYRVYDKRGIAPCLNKAEGGGRTPYIVQDEEEKNNN